MEIVVVIAASFLQRFDLTGELVIGGKELPKWTKHGAVMHPKSGAEDHTPLWCIMVS